MQDDSQCKITAAASGIINESKFSIKSEKLPTEEKPARPNLSICKTHKQNRAKFNFLP